MTWMVFFNANTAAHHSIDTLGIDADHVDGFSLMVASFVASDSSDHDKIFIYEIRLDYKGKVMGNLFDRFLIDLQRFWTYFGKFI